MNSPSAFSQGERVLTADGPAKITAVEMPDHPGQAHVQYDKPRLRGDESRCEAEWLPFSELTKRV